MAVCERISSSALSSAESSSSELVLDVLMPNDCIRAISSIAANSEIASHMFCTWDSVSSILLACSAMELKPYFRLAAVGVIPDVLYME